jgi:hypothetical protein
MNKIKFLLLFFAIWLSSSPVLAQTLLAKPTTWSIQTFRHVGIVDQVSRRSIFIDDNKYLLSPTAKFTTVDNSDAGISLLEKRQMVGFSTIIINNRQLVDHLWLIPEDERGFYRPQP